MITNLGENNSLVFGQQVNHFSAVSNIQNMPNSHIPEICFAGRSNVGKSSLINAICERKNIARVSNTPGRTQIIHFYIVQNKLFITDLPGYGYAKAPKSKIIEWNKLIEQYLITRSRLQRAFILIDARHGIKESDHKMMIWLNNIALNFQCVLTKIDKVTNSKLNIIVKSIKLEIQKYTPAHPEIISTSAKKNIGINKIRGHLNLITKNFNNTELENNDT